MAYDISGFGIEARLLASVTFPAGFTLTEFADDADPITIDNQQIVDTAMSLNGDLLSWSTANPIPATIAVIPNSADDVNLSVLVEANRVGQGKRSNQDSITLVMTTPDGRSVTLTNGKLTEGPVANTVNSSGRLNSKSYQFRFENKVGV